MKPTTTMTRQLSILFAALVLPSLARALPAVQDPTVGNVRTTGFSLCWETTEPAKPGLRVFTDAAGTEEITDDVLIKFQALAANRREVASTPASRALNRDLQNTMNLRNIVLAQVSDLDPDTAYWVRAQTRDESGTVQDESPLLPLTTPARATFIVESRQLLIDLSGASAILGDLSGVIVRLDNPDSPYPLFAVVNDGPDGSRARFDLNHFLDPSGEANLVTQAGMTLDLVISFLGTDPITGEFSGNRIAYSGEATAARTSTASFTATGLSIVASSETSSALLGLPVSLRLEATDGSGTPLADFDGPLVLTSPALAGSPVTSAPLVDGVLARQEIILNTVGPQTVTVTDPGSGNGTTIDLNVLTYSYENFRVHFYGDAVNPEGALSANTDGDQFPNIVEFAHGLNPHLPDGPVSLDGSSNLVRRGGPAITIRIDSATGTDFRVTFLRHRDHNTLGVSYKPQFSSNLSTWFDSSNSPTVLGQFGDMELVSVTYPYFTPLARKSRFFRLSVTLVE